MISKTRQDNTKKKKKKKKKKEKKKTNPDTKCNKTQSLTQTITVGRSLNLTIVVLVTDSICGAEAWPLAVRSSSGLRLYWTAINEQRLILYVKRGLKMCQNLRPSIILVHFALIFRVNYCRCFFRCFSFILSLQFV